MIHSRLPWKRIGDLIRRPGLTLWLALFLALSILPITVSADDTLEARLQSVLDDYLAGNPSVPAIVVSLKSGKMDLNWNGAAGQSDRSTGQPISHEQPLRLASTTKTYVAAAVLRLMEMGKLSIDDTIERHLPADQLQLLRHGGYATSEITIRHLLTHTSGLWDYAQSKPFFDTVSANPHHRWTRIEQLRFAVEHGQAYGVPGEIYHYSDTGYILLGEIIERRSGLDFAAALRYLLAFDRLGLSATWLETLEPVPPTAADRAHQYMGEDDTNPYDPSFDLYGGGGLIASMPDLANFYGSLLRDEIYDSPATLSLMKTSIVPIRGGPGRSGPDRGPSQYCMGIVASEHKKLTIWSHSGFWGTQGAYVPALDLAIGLAITQQHASTDVGTIMHALLDQLMAK